MIKTERPKINKLMRFDDTNYDNIKPTIYYRIHEYKTYNELVKNIRSYGLYKLIFENYAKSSVCLNYEYMIKLNMLG